MKNFQLCNLGERVLARATYNLDFYPWYSNPIKTVDTDSELRVQVGVYIFHGYDLTKSKDGKPTRRIYRAELDKLKKRLQNHSLSTESLVKDGVEGNIAWYLTKLFTPQGVSEPLTPSTSN